MKRNTALFSASVVAGVVAATGMVVASSGSEAAVTSTGIAWSTTSSSHGWTTGAVGDSDGTFTAVATSGAVANFSIPALNVAGINVRSACTNGKVVTTVVGGGASGTHASGTSVSAAKFTGNSSVVGNVYFGSRTINGITVGAYFDLTRAGLGNYIALTGVGGCAAATTTSTTTSTSTSTTSSPTSTSTTSSPTSTTTSSPTSTTTTSSPTSTTTTSPTSTSTSTSTATSTSTSTGTPTTTEPTMPPSPTTTKLPVTG